MTEKQVEKPNLGPPPLPSALPADLKKEVKFSQPTDEDMNVLAQLRSSTEPWKARGETAAEALEALTKLRPFIHVAKLNNHIVGYITIERDGPVPGAAYQRNIVVNPSLQRKGLGHLLMEHGLNVAREMNRKTVALRVDPANSSAVNFYRKLGFTTVATVVSKKSGKLRLLMSKEL